MIDPRTVDEINLVIGKKIDQFKEQKEVNKEIIKDLQNQLALQETLDRELWIQIDLLYKMIDAFSGLWKEL